ncbi:MAG TPA: CPBP family intramembrane glutamic endopeptidase [Pyrinomonadaceae bacterium]|nr:CPBP family intramembrane glutamic endopeptidase [Pyrinomonadaceae bacterium]
MSFKKRLFLILFLAGFIGVLSFLLVDLAALIALVPIRPGVARPVIPPALKVLSLIQPSVLLAVAVLVGVVLAPRVGLTAPVAESLAAGRAAVSALRPQLIPGVVGALIGGLAIVLTSIVTKPFLPAETIALMEKFANVVPLPTRLLYGGITEELLIRWGLMTLFVWAVWRLFQRRYDKPASACFVAGILLSAFIFGLGHLPVALTLLGQVTVALVVFVIVANSAFGIVTGYLYWKYGLESAIVAHMLGHVVLVTATYAGLY